VSFIKIGRLVLCVGCGLVGREIVLIPMKIPCAEKESQNDEDSIKWREEKVSKMERNEPKWLEMGGREIQRNGGKL
jgi:hypothetical protein